MISKPNDTQASEAAWGYSALVWPQECDTKQGCKYSENRVREEEEMEAGGFLVRAHMVFVAVRHT